MLSELKRYNDKVKLIAKANDNGSVQALNCLTDIAAQYPKIKHIGFLNLEKLIKGIEALNINFRGEEKDERTLGQSLAIALNGSIFETDPQGEEEQKSTGDSEDILSDFTLIA